ncbi:uncharacterized protein LOC119660100 [Hermetia illucens]|uniref:uncharacterized protein LOC119660100 n=1 Tax=Hermetia illucens TaxID=343691 RepID=UPI0018CC6ECB|nr:uncharacterized protein LOC119660100 [Hermetia illucens]
MAKTDYDDAVSLKLRNGNFFELREDSMPESIKRVDRALKEASTIFKDITKLRMPNPSLPRIRCQPKIHKEGHEMREIIADSNSPTFKIAKWLVHEFSVLGNTLSKYAIRNTGEPTSKLQEAGHINTNEMMVSFDVKSLFPNTPIKPAIHQLEIWLNKLNITIDWRAKVRQYPKLASLCMGENYFTFPEKFYKTTAGVSMGNPMSPLVTEMFMAYVETIIEEKGIMPRIWFRYVDDIFAIVEKDRVDNTLTEINRIHLKIQFTIEKEEHGSLPFLDLRVTNNSGKLEFEIYRKPTATQRMIPATSAHTATQKMAAYNSMVHRLCTYPLNKDGFHKERMFILDTAIKNGYTVEIIEKLIKRKQEQIWKNQHSTLFEQESTLADTKWVSISLSKDFYRIKSLLGKYDIKVVGSSRDATLKR